MTMAAKSVGRCSLGVLSTRATSLPRFPLSFSPDAVPITTTSWPALVNASRGTLYSESSNSGPMTIATLAISNLLSRSRASALAPLRSRVGIGTRRDHLPACPHEIMCKLVEGLDGHVRFFFGAVLGVAVAFLQLAN